MDKGTFYELFFWCVCVCGEGGGVGVEGTVGGGGGGAGLSFVQNLFFIVLVFFFSWPEAHVLSFFLFPFFLIF